MAEHSDGIGLAEAIAALRSELLKAQAIGSNSSIEIPVESMTVELTVTATRSAEGKAGFKVPIVELEVGGSGGRKHSDEQKIIVTFGKPVDRSGRPVKVASTSNELKG